MQTVGGTYRLGPFLIGSELPLPELTLLDADLEPDAWFRFGEVPDEIAGVVAHETRWWASNSEYLQRVPKVASFLVRKGREIVVEPAPDSQPGDIRAYLLAPLFAQLCFQTGRYAIHASSVRVQDGVVAFPGDSGAGKSTLAAYLERRGFPVISDDMCLLDTGSGDEAKIRVIPVAPALKLWPSALRHMGASTAGLPKVWSQEEKFRMKLREPQERLPLREVVFLDWMDDPGGEPVVEPLSGVSALSRLLGLMHFEYLMKATGRQAECFQLCGRVLRQAKVSVLRRPKNFVHMEDAIDTLERHLRQEER